MKLIKAYIQPHKLKAVKASLAKAGITKMSVTNALGCGQQQGFDETYRGAVHEVNLLKKISLEIAINDDYVDAATKAIIEGAKTGNIGDGKIFVTSIDDAIRIRTGETGNDAIG